MSELQTDTNTETIADRVKLRTKIKERTGRVGGVEHQTKVLHRKRESIRRKKYAGRSGCNGGQ